jgi:hypothetical protein
VIDECNPPGKVYKIGLDFGIISAFPLLSAACLLQRSVGAPIIKERVSFRGLSATDQAEDHGVIAGIHDAVNPALQPGKRAFQQRNSAAPRPPGDILESPFGLRCENNGQIPLAVREYIDRKIRRGPEMLHDGAAEIDAYKDQRRLQ